MDNLQEYVSLNGEIQSKESPAFPYSDTGFLYGYGLFETLPIIRGIPKLLRDHLDRMTRGAIITDIPFDFRQDRVCKWIDELIEKNQVDKGVLNIYLTLGHRDNIFSQNATDPTLLMVIRDWPEFDPQKAISLEVREESFQRTPLDRVKTLSWIKNMLEKRLNTADEVILTNHQGQVLESTAANVFFVKDDRLITPKSSVILPGITRKFLIDQQDNFGVKIEERPVDVSELSSFDEIFLTSSVKGVVLVDNVQDYQNLKSAAMSRQIQKQFFSFLEY